MKKTKSLLLIAGFAAYCYPAMASVNTRFQVGQTINVDNESVVLPISNHSISLNPEIDAINPNDPRIKTVIEFVKSNNGMGVSVLFSNSENLRYVKKLNQMFAANGVYATEPQLTKSKNAIDFDLVKIYVIKYSGMLLESSSYVKKSTNPTKLAD
jgi:hypothetical protein